MMGNHLMTFTFAINAMYLPAQWAHSTAYKICGLRANFAQCKSSLIMAFHSKAAPREIVWGG